MNLLYAYIHTYLRRAKIMGLVNAFMFARFMDLKERRQWKKRQHTWSMVSLMTNHVLCKVIEVVLGWHEGSLMVKDASSVLQKSDT
ncbi:hypothetical protein L596_000590 [Steinernema carpocapsae]|uniref:Uncharacterized protein n=1 Tax=Steinernema carpocapsae TaxID=34508 RepID=A0A4U8UJX4_STECR|nr:hypothetical protein L596_000590 [Steinernema carpocapsae]